MKMLIMTAAFARFLGFGRVDRAVSTMIRVQRQRLNDERVVLEDQLRDLNQNQREAKRDFDAAKSALDCVMKRQRVVGGRMAQNTANFVLLKQMEAQHRG